MKINGTLVNYYFHCKRQCWLCGNRINLEDNSELVKIGKQLHINKTMNSKQKEIAIDSIKVDKIQGNYLYEYKKSNADMKAASWQLLYYLFILKKKGIEKEGKLVCMEKNKKTKKVVNIRLTKSIETILENLEYEISELINNKDIPEFSYSSKCKKCAYYSYCML
ncbi:Dna2/Cas4 domain-containing protein [Abyssisolibacter fermentans]|uniref:Dna2/Cas4 domain-containing protein n=1 Tax=Abyssisolibacter fermentans TaxID=1766203 RepID=UPI000832F047|nr:Dna2/Cas4 domain-containing protein [Abyssisolibacter fermentans]